MTTADLRLVQDRRKWPADMTQRGQLWVQNRVITPTLARPDTPSTPFLLRLYARLPFLHGIPARAIGRGLRPEYVDIDAIDRRP